METTQVCINSWKDKENMVHIHNGILSSLWKEGKLVTCESLMKLEGTMLSEIKQNESST